MATSRTGTAKYLRNRDRVIRDARKAGLTHCPGHATNPCGRELDYYTPLQAGSAEADHVLEHRYGGTDDVDNLRVLCRTCNLERNRTRPRALVPAGDDFPLTRDW